MYSRAETAADIAPAAVPVQGRQNADRIDYQYAGFRRISLRGQLCIAEGRTTDAADQTLDPVRVDLVRHDDELDVAVAIDHPEQQFFVGRPCAPRHENGPAGREALDFKQPLGPNGNRADPVETRVARHRYATDADASEQRPRLIVLHENMAERAQSPAKQTAVRPEKYLAAPENRRNQVEAHSLLSHREQVVDPELVLDENGHFRPEDAQKAPHIARSIGRKVEYPVGAGIVFPYFVTRRRKERQQNLVSGTCLAERLNHRASLLELPERGGVKPCNLVVRSDDLGHATENILASANPQPGLRIERRGHAQPGIHQQNAQIVKQSHRVISEYPQAPCGSVP